MKQYIQYYPDTPVGDLALTADEAGLTGLWLGRKDFAAEEFEEKDLRVFRQAREWLDAYFAGREPETEVPLHLTGSDFRKRVWEKIREIPYGRTVTYGEIAERIAGHKETPRTAARAVGGAVGHNPVSLIIPCHRVIGADGSVTGYAGGTDRKIQLLEMENADVRALPQRKRGRR
jgi:methylated-DNA-[protein]-cysteine S-methyltransferase